MQSRLVYGCLAGAVCIAVRGWRECDKIYGK
jgi:hypothetical protein